MIITICAGSSCSHRGSQKVVEFLVDYISINKLQKKWELKASFCMGDCGEHIAARIDDFSLRILPNSNYKQFFKVLHETNNIPNIAGITWRENNVK